jgi:hypothetical protein
MEFFAGVKRTVLDSISKKVGIYYPMQCSSIQIGPYRSVVQSLNVLLASINEVDTFYEYERYKRVSCLDSSIVQCP